MGNLIEQLERATAASAAIGDSAAGYAALSEEDLLHSHAQIALIRRHWDKQAAFSAGEIARRSSPELGNAGLAQRNGFITPEALIQSTSGSTRAEAAKLVAVGTLMTQTEAAEELHQADPGSPFAGLPWLAVIASAVSNGSLSVDAAEAIRKGLGDVDPAVPAEKLAAAATFLLGEARTLNADLLLRRARRLRDALDADGIARREKTQHDDRSFRIWKQANGMYRVSALLAPEDGRLVELIVDDATSPRRGGPRFVDPDLQQRARAIQDDERSNEQIAADTILTLLHIAIDADPNTMFLGRRPTLKVLVTEHSLATQSETETDSEVEVEVDFESASRHEHEYQDEHEHGQGRWRGHGDGDGEAHEHEPGHGHGELDGHPDPVSLETVQRHACTGFTAIKFDDDGQCVNVGRDQRLFTERQRTGLAARDGGCRWPNCDRPPSWTEAHHIDHWQADHGKTDIADGLLLCRAHHLLLHNNGWHVIRADADYWLIPPVATDPRQIPIPMPSKSPLMLELFPSRLAERRSLRVGFR